MEGRFAFSDSVIANVSLGKPSFDALPFAGLGLDGWLASWP